MNASGRFALVFGNGAYQDDEWRLASPPLDAEATRAKLTALGFDVAGGPNLGLNDMKSAVAAFVERLRTAPRVDAALFYYSGHGCARAHDNLMLPIDFDSGAEARLLSLQKVVDEISSARTQEFAKIVLFDACRVDDENADSFVRRLDAAVVGKSAPALDGAPTPLEAGQFSAKYASVTAGWNTFIAFATAEGQEAYGTQKGMSLFTAALVRNLDAIDLPLTNLLIRVRREVSERSGQAQITFDQSSLNQPFYFNPGSILLFTGNAMALVGLILSLIPYSLALAAGLPWTWTATAALLPAFSLAILLYGMQSVYTRLKGRFEADKEGPPSWREHLTASLQKGVLGGYLGSLFGGLAIGGTYYLAWARVDRAQPDFYDPLAPLGAVLTEITISTALTACLLGFLSLLGARLSWRAGRLRVVAEPTAARLMLGAILGGVVAGILAAPILTVYFGLKSRPDMTPDLLIPGSLMGAAFVVFSIVNFDLERLTLRRIATGLAAALAALILGALFAATSMAAFYAIGLVGWVTDFLHAHAEDPWGLAEGGAIYGAPVGAMLGFVIGVAAALTRRWSDVAVLGGTRADDETNS